MRFRAGLSLIYPLLIGIALTSGVLINAGCGGGSSDAKSGGTPTPAATPTPTPTPPPANPVPLRAVVIWGPRSRQTPINNAVGGPSSALSAIVRLSDPSGTGTPFTQTVNRGVTSGRQEYTSSPATIRPGLYNLQVQFFANENATGPLVGTAAASATILLDGTLSTTIATFGTIQKVVIPAGQFVNVGQTKTVIYEPRDASDNLIAVTPGSAFVSLVTQQSTVPGQPAATVQGEDITGVNPLKVSVTVKVDDSISPPADIQVRSALTLTISPNPGDISILETQQFTADITNDGPSGSNGVTWVVKEGVTAGTITSGGLFTATRNEGVYTVVATSNYDPAIVVETPITVLSKVAVTVTPNPVPTISWKGLTQQFTASVSHVPAGQDGSVVWKVKQGSAGGTITADGLYTSPNVEGDFTVVATSRFDDRKFLEVTVPVRSPVTAVTVTPNPVPPVSFKGGTVQFAATVVTIPAGKDAGVDWSIKEGATGGTITTGGLYTTGTTIGDFTIVARSRFDNRVFKEVVVPVRSLVTVDVTPNNPAPISINASRDFDATVLGVPPVGSTAVTWSVRDAANNLIAGAIDANGFFTAPSTPGVYRIIATSVFDTNKSGSENITVQSGNQPIIIK